MIQGNENTYGWFFNEVLKSVLEGVTHTGSWLAYNVHKAVRLIPGKPVRGESVYDVQWPCRYETRSSTAQGHIRWHVAVDIFPRMVTEVGDWIGGGKFWCIQRSRERTTSWAVTTWFLTALSSGFKVRRCWKWLVTKRSGRCTSVQWSYAWWPFVPPPEYQCLPVEAVAVCIRPSSCSNMFFVS